jgi:serine/threonine-protein kinase RsbW
LYTDAGSRHAVDPARIQAVSGAAAWFNGPAFTLDHRKAIPAAVGQRSSTMTGSVRVDPDGGVLMQCSLPASLNQLSYLVEQVESSIVEAGLPMELGLQFTLAFDEILTNLASHATQVAGREIQVEVALRLYPDRLDATVWDDGPAFDMTQAADPDIEAGLAERAVGGLGLFIVRNVMDEVVYDRLGARNRLFLIKRLDPEA